MYQPYMQLSPDELEDALLFAQEMERKAREEDRDRYDLDHADRHPAGQVGEAALNYWFEQEGIWKKWDHDLDDTNKHPWDFQIRRAGGDHPVLVDAKTRAAMWHDAFLIPEAKKPFCHLYIGLRADHRTGRAQIMGWLSREEVEALPVLYPGDPNPIKVKMPTRWCPFEDMHDLQLIHDLAERLEQVGIS
jgi:hypothetical protein